MLSDWFLPLDLECQVKRAGTVFACTQMVVLCCSHKYGLLLGTCLLTEHSQRDKHLGQPPVVWLSASLRNILRDSNVLMILYSLTYCNSVISHIMPYAYCGCLCRCLPLLLSTTIMMQAGIPVGHFVRNGAYKIDCQVYSSQNWPNGYLQQWGYMDMSLTYKAELVVCNF